jgi:hypothetical protein
MSKASLFLPPAMNDHLNCLKTSMKEQLMSDGCLFLLFA